MNIVAKYSLSLFAVAILAGCSGAQTSTENTDGDRAKVPSVASSVDHHEGETNVMPHDDSQTGIDHHEGETDVVPHGHSVSSHDDSNEPPHRH